MWFVALGMFVFGGTGAAAWAQTDQETPWVTETEEFLEASDNLSGGGCDGCRDQGFDEYACCGDQVVDWSKVPGSIRLFPRLGFFPVPPTGCHYYSLCDQWRGISREAPPKSGYAAFAKMPPPFYDADFRYVDALPCEDRTLVERLKRMQWNDCWMFSTGGQAWARFMNEYNSRLTETDNSYTLNRVRLFGDLMYGDVLRFYGEFIWADSYSEELPPLPTDVNLGDILDLFVDVNLFEYDGHPVYGRVGRQEMLLGSQRLISTVDWVNTRRTFEGARLFRQGDQWDFDLFWVEFVPPLASEFDEPDDNQDFAGAWLTYRPEKGAFLDFYYLMLDNSNSVTQQGIVRYPAEIHTLGTRYVDDHEGFLWDTELMLQVGEQNGEDLIAGAVSAGLGRHFASAPAAPTVWVYYDFASGDSDPNVGDATTFNQLYGFGHYYLGWLDQVGRQNIHDLNAHLYFYPEAWITVWLQYHHFWLNQSRDALYNAAGNAIRRDPTGMAGTNVGDEVDVVLNFHVARYSDVMVGYSYLFGGGFLEATSTPTLAADSSLFYAAFQQKW